MTSYHFDELVVDWLLDVDTCSEMNMREHWHDRFVRHNIQKRCVWAQWHQEKPKIKLPCLVVLTRISCRKLDSDNNVMAFKAIRDEVANQLRPGLLYGKADDTDDIQWEYRREKGLTRKKMIRIQIFIENIDKITDK